MSKGNKKLKKFKITSIYGWEEDRHMEDGDACHCSEGDVMRKRLHEYEEKVENDNWPGLPFECMAEDEDDAIRQYNDKYCDYDYFKATEAEFESRYDFEPLKLRQVIGVLQDDTTLIIDRGDGKKSIMVFKDDFTDEDEKACRLLDPYLDREVKSVSPGISPSPMKRNLPTLWVTLYPDEKAKKVQ